MDLISAKISPLSAYVLRRVLTNSDLEKMIDTSDAWWSNGPASGGGTLPIGVFQL